MEENQPEYTNPAPVEQPETPTSNEVSFPSPSPIKKSGGPKTLLVLGILVVLGVIGFLFFKSAASNKDSMSDEQPFTTDVDTSGGVTVQPTVEPSPTPSAADKAKVSFSIQNGTGISGEAAYLQNQLKPLGYEDFSLGNASSQDETTTTVTFSKDLADSIVAEITAKLKDLYKTVDVKSGTSTKADVVIVTGLKKGATAKPASTAEPTAKATSSASASATPTPTATN